MSTPKEHVGIRTQQCGGLRQLRVAVYNQYEAPEALTGGRFYAMRKKKILVADHDEINLDFFNLMLSKLGYNVEKAADGEEALEKIMNCDRLEAPHLAIVNAVLPKTSGWEILKTVKKHPATAYIPVILMSEIDDVKEIAGALEHGAEDYIVKPFNFSVVLARIRAALRMDELFSQLRLREDHLGRAERAGNDLEQAACALKEAATDLVSGITGDSDGNAGVSPVKEKARLLLDAVTKTEKCIEQSRSEREKLNKRETLSAVLEKLYTLR
jgi:CheY-like chemotaxis protein